MGIGSSRERYGYYNQNKYQQQQKRQYLRKTTSTQSIPVLSLHNNYYPNGSFYPYGGLQPPPYPSIGYNAYPQQQQMMMMPPPPPPPSRTPAPYYNPSPQLPSSPLQPVIPTPYAQQQVPIMQPFYNNINSPSAPAATPYYSPSTPAYHSSPARLLTDWTGGGKISPGFLGPPI